MEDLQTHEKTFNDVQDRGEVLIRQQAVGSAMCESYLSAMQERWGWLLTVTSCIDAQLNNAQAYNQVSRLQVYALFQSHSSYCAAVLMSNISLLTS